MRFYIKIYPIYYVKPCGSHEWQGEYLCLKYNYNKMDIKYDKY